MSEWICCGVLLAARHERSARRSNIAGFVMPNDLCETHQETIDWPFSQRVEASWQGPY
jgi:hypothetical protein